jgi:4-amino-4-deoxy-L-arabinose transferase-like glycosyltransferase
MSTTPPPTDTSQPQMPANAVTANTQTIRLLDGRIFALAIIVGLAVLKLVIHLLTSSTYGYFRDEFYYIAASKHLSFGYVDFPPFIALLTAFVRVTLGDSLLALHFFPALAGAGVILLTGMMARQLGADPFGQVLAALAALIAPQYLGTNALLTMDSFDLLAWAAALYVLILILKYDRPKLWLVFGLVIGIGLTIKVTPIYFGLALVIGLVLTPYRRYFRNPYLYLGGLIALAFLAPYALWNAASGWPTIEFWRNYGNKVFQASPLVFLLQQAAIMHPFNLPLWLSGLVFLFTQKGKPYRLFGWMYLVLLFIFMLQNAKNYFLAPFYPVLFAAGTIAMQQFAGSRGWHWLGWLRANYILVLVIGGILLAPLTIPLLPVDTEVAFVRALGGTNVKTESAETGVLPQNFADRFGWEELAATMSAVYRSLPAKDQVKACILTSNYGEAGALQFYSSKYDLPPVISGHNSYYLWGPGSCTGDVLLYLGQAKVDDLEQVFADARQVAVTQCQYCMPFENDLPIFLCRGIKVSLDQAWPQTKFFQ